MGENMILVVDATGNVYEADNIVPAGGETFADEEGGLLDFSPYQITFDSDDGAHVV
jgi:hypothetical protein